MGSDKKSKEDRKKSRSHRSPSSQPSTDDEGKSRKRHRREEEEGRRSRKSDDKGRRKDKKSHKHRSDREKKKDKRRSKRHKTEHHSKGKIQELSSDDYFSKNNEFSTWLKEEKKLFFSDLSSESARELFSDFVKDWNSQKLESRYYEGIATGPRSAHNWAFKQ